MGIGMMMMVVVVCRGREWGVMLLDSSVQESVYCVAEFGQGIVGSFSPIFVVCPESELAFEVSI